MQTLFCKKALSWKIKEAKKQRSKEAKGQGIYSPVFLLWWDVAKPLPRFMMGNPPVEKRKFCNVNRKKDEEVCNLLWYNETIKISREQGGMLL